MRRRASQWFLIGAVTIMVIAVGLNLAAVWRSPVSAPAVRYSSGSLTELAHDNQRSVDRRFAFYLELDDRTEGGVLVLPEPPPADPELVEGFSDLTVETRFYDPTAVPSSVARLFTPLGELEIGEGFAAYSILPGEPGETRWIGRIEEGIVVVPESLAPVPGGEG